MNRRIIYMKPDGGVSVVIPCRCIEDGELTDDDILNRALERIPKEAINPQIVTTAELPQDRTFRNAWEHGGDKVTVNMDKAKAIHLERIRRVRNEKLQALDVDTMKAVGVKDDVTLAAVEKQKQDLRDIPQTLDLTIAQTPEELKAIWPKELD